MKVVGSRAKEEIEGRVALGSGEREVRGEREMGIERREDDACGAGGRWGSSRRLSPALGLEGGAAGPWAGLGSGLRLAAAGEVGCEEAGRPGLVLLVRLGSLSLLKEKKKQR